VIQKLMKFDCPLRPLKLCPVKSAQAQINYGRVKAYQFVFKAELLSAPDFHRPGLEQRKKNLLIQFPRTMLVGIGERGSAWSSDFQMLQFTFTTSQPSGNLSEGMGATHLAEWHGNKLAPSM
jgi:hypothetical protein